MICHADSDDDDDLIMSRVVIEIVMNPMCWKSDDGNCDGWKVCSLCLSTSHTRPLPCSRDGNLLNCLTNQYSCLFDLWSQWKRGRWWSWWRRSPASPRSQQSTNLLHLPPPPLMRFAIITVITIFDTSIIVIHLINWDQVNTAYLAELEGEKERLEASQQDENTSSTSSHLLRLLENGRCLEKKQR